MSFFEKKRKHIDIAFVSHDGIKAVENIKKSDPDILILDMVMPHLDGLGVLEMINNMDLEKYPRTIVLSAVGSGSYNTEGDKPGSGILHSQAVQPKYPE